MISRVFIVLNPFLSYFYNILYVVFPIPELFFFKHSRSFSVPKVPTREPKRLFFLSSAYIETKIWEVFFVSQDVSLKMTELDRLTSLPHMQLVKAALPYIHIPEQRFFSLFVKFRELEKTMQLFARSGRR